MSSHKGMKLKTYSKSQKIQLVTKFVKEELPNNLNRKIFAEENGVNYKTFCDWLGSYKRGELGGDETKEKNIGDIGPVPLPYHLIENELIEWAFKSMIEQHFLTLAGLRQKAELLLKLHFPSGPAVCRDDWLRSLMERNNIRILDVPDVPAVSSAEKKLPDLSAADPSKSSGIVVAERPTPNFSHFNVNSSIVCEKKVEPVASSAFNGSISNNYHKTDNTGFPVSSLMDDFQEYCRVIQLHEIYIRQMQREKQRREKLSEELLQTSSSSPTVSSSSIPLLQQFRFYQQEQEEQDEEEQNSTLPP
jgi:hypothetical protein